MKEEYPDYIWNINERKVEFESTEAIEVTIETHDPELITRDKKVRLYLISIVYLTTSHLCFKDFPFGCGSSE